MCTVQKYTNLFLCLTNIKLNWYINSHLKTSFYKLTKSKNSIAQIKIDHKKQEDTDQLQQNSYPLFLKLITKQPVFLLIITEQVILKIPRRNKNKQKQPISSSKEKSKKKHKFNSQSISMLDISLQNFKGILVRWVAQLITHHLHLPQTESPQKPVADVSIKRKQHKKKVYVSSFLSGAALWR